MQILCGLQVVFFLFNCQTPGYGALAQLVEHLTFNQVVRGSNPRCFIV